MIRISLLFILVLFCGSIFGQILVSDKIGGVSLESPPNELQTRDFEPISQINANWVAVIPYGFSRENLPAVHYDSNRQWWGERLDGAAEMISMAKINGLKVMLKPQVWIFRGWVGNYGFDTEQEWKEWETSYSEFILAFANMADSLQVDLFCLGTEYRKAVVERPQFWEDLIDKVKVVFDGNITYAANWDEYEDVGFWDKMDYIGVDAYFPLTETATPLIEELVSAWKPIKSDLKAMSDSLQKPMLFTEYGYRSVDGAAGQQWDLDGRAYNPQAQRKAYLAFFESFWNEEWVAGGFFWKWHFAGRAGGEEDKRYTPQGKPALKIIENTYR